MRTLRFLNIALLAALLGSAALLCAQDEKQQENKPAQDEMKPPKQDEAKPSKQEEAKPSKQDKQEQKQEQQKAHDNATPAGKQNQEMHGNEHGEMQGERAPQGQERPETHGQNGHPAGRGGHIPDDKFHAHFGRGHSFHAQGVIVAGQPQFQYGGYSFELVDAWPSDWAYTDDCYIDYIDGEYFLFDLLHPGIRIAVFVVM
ncbi:MAG TPA: hypothetical protein VND65_04955 [Candidatus Binatia bacterium]|nr:hypothetical protein [Candidatus Binatia bacterium]